MQPYAARRTRAFDSFAGGTAIVPAARTQYRNGDSSFAFRQNSDFFYLTGFNEPDAVLVLSTAGADPGATLFLRDRDRTAETWNGPRLGVEAAAGTLGIERTYPIDRLAELLPGLLVGASTLYYAQSDPAMDAGVDAALRTARERTRSKGRAPHAIADPSGVLGAMRCIKDDSEIETVRRACAMTAAGFDAAMRATRPGRFEYELQAAIEAAYRAAGSQHPAYESIVASGDNATVLHYVSNRDRLAPGTLLLVDSGCELDCYATDVTRTWPVSGRFSAEQRAIYEIVLAAQLASIDQVRPGVARNAFHDAAVATIVDGLIDLGLLQGTRDENIERETYREYYMHGTGHWMGLDVHDAGAYRDERDEPVTFAPGMVTTVEPGIYVRRDAECDQHFKGVGVRIEDDILVTAEGNENLTAAIPKEVATLEAIVGTAAG